MNEKVDIALKIYLVENEQGEKGFFYYLNQVYELGCPQKHILVKEPEKADIILFVDFNNNRFSEGLRNHKLVKQFPEKCFVYSESDIVTPFLPGIYTSACYSWLNFRRLRSYCYLSRFTYSQNGFIAGKKNQSKNFLFSFLGGSTSLVRKRLFNIDFKRGDVLVENTSYYQHWNYDQDCRAEMQQKYIDICTRSKFVLCPRGAGSGSIRLFEIMEMGLVPVIISDNYLLPEGPEWEEFAIFIKEKNLRKVPEILLKRVSDVEIMGNLARKAWEEWFAPTKQFNYIIDSCWDIRKRRLIPERIYQLSWIGLIFTEFINGNIRDFMRKIVLQTFRILKIKFPYSLTRD